jgi:hypothetical protein
MTTSQLSRYSNWVTGWTTVKSCFDSRQGMRYYSSPKRQDKLWGPPSLLFNGYQGHFPRELSARDTEANHSCPRSTQVKNGWRYISIPLHALMVFYLNLYNENSGSIKLRNLLIICHDSRKFVCIITGFTNMEVLSLGIYHCLCNEINNFRGLFSSPTPYASLVNAIRGLGLIKLLLTRPTGLAPSYYIFIPTILICI